MKRAFEVPDYKPAYAQWFVKIDVSAWLEDETLNTCTVTAVDLADNSDVTTTVLDTSKTVISGAVIKPFLQGGTSGHSYRATVKLSTTEGSKDELYLYWNVLDNQK